MTVDLRDDAQALAAYRKHHRAVWPEVLRSLSRVGVLGMDIYALGRRLVMIMDAKDGFDLRRSFAAHAASDPRSAEWQELMKTFQRAPPGAPPGRLWTAMDRVFSLRSQLRATGATRKAATAPSVRSRLSGRRLR